MSGVRDWATENQARLMEAVARVRAALDGREVVVTSEGGTAGVPAFALLRDLFALSPFELDVLLLCAGSELSDEFAAAVNEFGGPSFGLALGKLPAAHWSAVTPGAPLRYWRLVTLHGSGPLTRRELRIDERVLHFLTGVDHVDEQLEAYVEPLWGRRPMVPSHAEVVERIVEIWRRPLDSPPSIQLIGTDLRAAAAITVEAATKMNWRLFRLGADVLPPSAEALHSLSRLWNREAVLANAALLIDARGFDAAAGEQQRRIDALVTRVSGPVIVHRDQPVTSAGRPSITVRVARASRSEQETVWRQALGEDTVRLNGQIEEVTAQFDLDVAMIESAALDVRASAARGELIDTALWRACRGRSRETASGLTRRLELLADWDDLVLHETQRRQLREIITHVRRRCVVHETWGFGRKTSRGLGVSALFAGASGTGKTMAAEVMARELKLDLLHVDLSCVVSKYIGETEKNLSRVFEEAEAGGAILLFDEADALFGRRSEVQDSHDRYANLEVSYLLQRMEAYRGLAILTTNLKRALDDAFQRRLRFVVNFPFPGPEARVEIWRRTIPAETPVDGLDFDRLGQLNASGGTIRTIALHAAFLAADCGEPLRMRHLLTAAQTVYAKREVPLTESEKRGWA